MKAGARKAAALAKEIRRRQTAVQSHKLTVAPPPPVKTPRQYHEAFGPRPTWCDWQSWGYLMPERDGIDIQTGYYRVVDLASVGTFAELRGQVKP